MTSLSAAGPTMTSRFIENSLHIGSKFTEQMDPMELSSLNELLDRIAALGVATDYDRIGLKPDQRMINSPPVTHQIAVVEEQCGDSPSILRMNYVRIPELSKPDTHSREDISLTLNLESGCIPNLRGNIPEPELPRSEIPLPHDHRLGQGLCRCQNRRISGRGSRTVRLRLMVTGDMGHDVYPGFALLMEVKPYVLLD